MECGRQGELFKTFEISSQVALKFFTANVAIKFQKETNTSILLDIHFCTKLLAMYVHIVLSRSGYHVYWTVNICDALHDLCDLYHLRKLKNAR